MNIDRNFSDLLECVDTVGSDAKKILDEWGILTRFFAGTGWPEREKKSAVQSKKRTNTNRNRMRVL